MCLHIPPCQRAARSVFGEEVPICSQSLLFWQSHMPASLQPSELRHDTAVPVPPNKDSLLDQIYPPCHLHCHLIICLSFLAALMQPLSAVIIGSLQLDTSQFWMDLLVFPCFLCHPLHLIKGKHTYNISHSACFLSSEMQKA